MSATVTRFEPAFEYTDRIGDTFRIRWCGAYNDNPRMCGYHNTETDEDIELTCKEVQRRVAACDWVDTAPVLECLDGPDDCSGPVEYRSVDGYKSWPRCEKHFDERLAKQEHIDELTSDVPASWFDEANAGERWDEE